MHAQRLPADDALSAARADVRGALALACARALSLARLEHLAAFANENGGKDDAGGGGDRSATLRGRACGSDARLRETARKIATRSRAARALEVTLMAMALVCEVRAASAAADDDDVRGGEMPIVLDFAFDDATDELERLRAAVAVLAPASTGGGAGDGDDDDDAI